MILVAELQKIVDHPARFMCHDISWIAMKRVINFVVESVAYFKHFSEKGFGPITLIVLFIGFLHARMRKNLTILELYAFNIIYEASQKW